MSRSGSSPRTPAQLVFCGLMMVFAVCASPAGAGPERDRTPRTTLGRPGYLVMTGAHDSTAAYFWQDGPGPGRHSLVWPEGTLSLPLELGLDRFGAADGGLACGPDLSGVGGSGRLLFQDGIYQISEPVLLADGVLELHLAGGEIEVRGDQIRYRRPVVKESRTRANYIFLAGLVLLIVVLMRRARAQTRKA